MSYSLLFKKNTKKRVESVPRRDTVSRAPSASAIQDGLKHGQMRFIHSSTITNQFWVNYPFNTGLHATWAMSFSTLTPDSRTLVSKWNTKLALIWKEDFGPLGNSPVLLLLSPGKTLLTLSVVQEWLNKRNTTTVAKFLDTSVCGGSWCLDPSLSPFLVQFTQILESILLDNPHKAAVFSVGCASFSSTLLPSTQLSVNMLGYSTLWTASFFGNECLWLTLLVKGVNDCLLDNCQISSLAHDCVA